MRFKLISDLHLEFFDTPQARSEAIKMVCEGGGDDIVLLIAGDLDDARNIEEVLRKISRAYRAVVYVLGNHEFYGLSVGVVKDIVEAIDIPNVYILNPGIVDIDNIRIIGATLWTNLLSEHPWDITNVQSSVADFKVIAGMNPEVFTRLHVEDRNFIVEQLTEANEKGLKSLVLTHHFPSYKCVHPRFESSPLNPAFAARLDDVILGFSPQYWLFGHTHDTVRVTIGETITFSNPFGYITYDTNPRFSMDDISEI